jgi:hypothetical protein
MTKTIPDTLVDRIDRKILHMLLIIGRYTKKNLFKEAVGASLESSRLPLQIVVKKRPARSKNRRKLQITMPCSTPESSPQIFSHTAHEETQISNISRKRRRRQSSDFTYSRQIQSTKRVQPTEVTYGERKEVYQHALIRGCCTSYSSSSALASPCCLFLMSRGRSWSWDALQHPDHGR